MSPSLQVCVQVRVRLKQYLSTDDDSLKAWCVCLGVSAHVCSLVTVCMCVCVCELAPHCAGLQRPKRLLLPLGGSGLKIMWCAMSGGEQGADSKEPERHTYTHTQSNSHTRLVAAALLYRHPPLYGYLTHRLNIPINVSIHKQK